MTCSTYFNTKNMQEQNFSFSKPIMAYIFDNSASKLFKRLNQSCKYIFAKYNYNIIDEMRFYDFTLLGEEYFHRYRFIAKQSFTKFSNNLWLTYLLAIDNANSMFYSKLMSKIVRCEIRTLSIHGSENLKFEDFVFLTESESVTYLDLKNTKVVKSDNTEVPIEEIFGQVLKVTFIVLDPCHITNDTMKVLLSQKRINKFTEFRLENIDKLLDAKMFINFINKFADKSVFYKDWRLKISFVNEEDSAEFRNVFDPFYIQNRYKV